jgi:DNA polymerase III epsilon subunit-like protein
MGLEYYIADTETTGLSVDKHEINQISILRVSDEKQVTYQIKVRNPSCYDFRALDIQGINPKELYNGILLEEATTLVDDFFKEDGKTKAHRCVICHNAPFDRKFLYRAWDNVDKEFLADIWLDTQALAKRYVAKSYNAVKIAEAQVKGGVDGIKTDKYGALKPKFGLGNLIIGFGIIPDKGAHQAEVDVKNLYKLYKWLSATNTEHLSLLERLPHKETKTVDLDICDF